MNNKFAKFNFILSLCLLLFQGCARDNKTFENGYADKNKLIQDFSSAVFSNDQKKITELLVNRKEYRDLVYPNMPAGDMKHGAVSADTHWETFVVRYRDAAIDTYLKSLLNKNCKLENIGKPETEQQFKKIKFFKKTGIEYTCGSQVKNPEAISDNRLFGVIVEKAGKFKVLNTFRD